MNAAVNILGKKALKRYGKKSPNSDVSAAYCHGEMCDLNADIGNHRTRTRKRMERKGILPRVYRQMT
jgi:hypothetical protein